MNYGELKSQFEGLLKRRDLTTTARDAYLQSALSRCQSLLRVPAMEKSFTQTLDVSYGGMFPVPADYIRLKTLIVSGVELRARSVTEVLAARQNTGKPTMYVRRGGNFVFGPYPETTTVLEGDYYAELTALAVDADTNWLSLIKPFAILYAALSEAAPSFVDRRGDSWEAYFQRAITELQDQADQDELVNAAVSPGITYPEDDF